MAERDFLVLGGTPEDVSKAADFYKHYYNSMVHMFFSDATPPRCANTWRTRSTP
jgi:hypothetical protein